MAARWTQCFVFAASSQGCRACGRLPACPRFHTLAWPSRSLALPRSVWQPVGWSTAVCATTPTAVDDAATTVARAPAVSAAEDPEPGAPLALTGADLQAFLDASHQGAGARLVPLSSVPAAAAGVKSLLFMVAGQPLLLLLMVQDRVDEGKVARLLSVPRNAVRMARAGEVVEVCGYAPGCVPPVGHRRLLPTLMDAACSRQEVLYGGGGEEGLEVEMQVPVLMRLSAAQVVHLARREATSPPAAPLAQPSDSPLPVPWAAGSGMVHLMATVASKRRIARLLTFTHVVPRGGADVAPSGRAANYVRQRWAHPESGRAVQVQLILGKTLERSLGADATAALMKAVKIGSTVRVVGRPQERPPRLDSAAGRAGEAESSGSGEAAADATLDLVVHSLEVVNTKRGALRLLGGARGAGGVFFPRKQPQTLRLPSGSVMQLPPTFPGPFFEGLPAGGPAGAEEEGAGAEGGTEREGAVGSGAQGAEAGQVFWRMPLPQTAVTVVDSMPSLASMHHALAPYMGATTATGRSLIVGLDCEWRPYSRGEPSTPVSILQVATPSHVFIVDLLWACTPEAPGKFHSDSADPCPAAPTSPIPGSGPSATACSAPAPGGTMPEGRGAALEAVLGGLFGAPWVTKVGFGFDGDMRRLMDSYPAFACFHTAPVPYIDILDVARTAAGPQPGGLLLRTSLSALCTCWLGAPLDKEQQRSDWGARPLRAAQVAYAANDAYCLLALWDSVAAHRGAEARRQERAAAAPSSAGKRPDTD